MSTPNLYTATLHANGESFAATNATSLGLAVWAAAMLVPAHPWPPKAKAEETEFADKPKRTRKKKAEAS